MIWAKAALAGLKSMPVQQFGLRQPALFLIERREVVEAC
jgi:hypothetical protein